MAKRGRTYKYSGMPIIICGIGLALPDHVMSPLLKALFSNGAPFSRLPAKNSQPLVTCIYIGLLDKNVFIALEVHAHGYYHVMFS